MYGYIYKTTNLINNKFYIGQKKSSYFLENNYLGSGYILKEAVKKYGKENFKVELLDIANDKDDLDEKEKYWISYFNAVESDQAYNIACGGQGGQIVPPHIQTEEEKQKRSESLKKAYEEGRHEIIKAGYPKGKKRSEEDRLANIKRNKNKIWIRNITLNQQKTIQKEELDKYISEGWERGRLPNSKPAWNKGLTKETDDRLKAISEQRLELFKTRPEIGCYGVKGNKFQKGIKKKDLK